MNNLVGNKGSSRKRPNPDAVKPRYRPTSAVAAKKLNNTSSTPFDSIMNEIEAFDNTNKKRQKEKKARERKSIDGNDNNKEAASSSKMMSSNLPPTPLPSSYLALTRAEVARSDVEDSSMVRKFLKKDGLMERILGYKMMRGRVEPYNIMKLVVNLEDCVSPVYEQNAETLSVFEAQQSKPSHHRPPTSRVLDLCSSPLKPSEASPSPNQPNSLVARRGPQTPPGSPGPADVHNNNSSRSSATHLENDQEAGSKSNLNQTSLPPPPIFPNLSENKELASDRTALLQQMASLTNTSVTQLEDFMGEDLQNAIGKMDKSVLLSTLKSALRDVTTAQMPKIVKANGQEQSKLPDSSSLGGCENMDISSEQSVTEQVVACGGYAFDSPLLPPPPMAPKPLSPPPPPPPMSAIISPSATTIPFSPRPPQFAQPVLPPPFSFAIPPPVAPGLVANMLSSQPQSVASGSSLQPINHQYSSSIKDLNNYMPKKAPAVAAGPIYPQRPVTVNLDFIKSRPPPPIPEILKQHGVSGQIASVNSENMAGPNMAPVTTNFTTPPPPVPFVPAKQAALPTFSVNQPPPTIQHNTPIASVASKENPIYSSRQQPKVLNKESVNFADFSTTPVQPKIVQQNPLFTTLPPPFPTLPNFNVPPPSTSQDISSQLHQQPNTNLYQMPPPNINIKDRQQNSYTNSMENSNNVRPLSSSQPIQDFSTPPPNFSKLPPPPPFPTSNFDPCSSRCTIHNNGFQPELAIDTSRPPPNESSMPIAMPLNSMKTEVKAEIIEEESPIKAIHHHNRMFKTLMSALGTSKPECSSAPEQPCNPPAPAIQSLMSSNYAPPSPLPQLSTSKKLRAPSTLRNGGNRRDKNRSNRQTLPKNRRRGPKKESDQPPNIWDSIEM